MTMVSQDTYRHRLRSVDTRVRRCVPRTTSLAVAKRPCDSCVGQFWPNVTGRWYLRTL